eukprot:708637-Pyramimonas_sp.AAC.1
MWLPASARKWRCKSRARARGGSSAATAPDLCLGQPRPHRGATLETTFVKAPRVGAVFPSAPARGNGEGM